MKVNGASGEIGSDGPGIFALWFGEFYSAQRTEAYLHIKPEVVGVSRPYCRRINAVQILQRQHVSTSGSISVPSEIKASLLRALQAKRETHVNLLVTHSYLLTSTQHVIYLLYNYFYFY